MNTMRRSSWMYIIRIPVNTLNFMNPGQVDAEPSHCHYKFMNSTLLPIHTASIIMPSISLTACLPNQQITQTLLLSKPAVGAFLQDGCLNAAQLHQ